MLRPTITAISRAIEARTRETSLDLGGKSVRVPTAAHLRWQPNWKADLFEELGVARRGLIDVGANDGQTLLDFLAVGGRKGYVGFEPLPAAAATVQLLLRANSVTDSTVVPIALSDRHGVVPLFIPAGDETSATLRAGLRPGRQVRRDVVSMHPLDEIWHEVAPETALTFVKIDVEGVELEVLRGMRSLIAQHRPVILCEVLDADGRADMNEHDLRLGDLEHLLRELDYAIERVAKPDGRLHGTTPVETFPRRVWTNGTAEECDYLFHPG